MAGDTSSGQKGGKPLDAAPDAPTRTELQPRSSEPAAKSRAPEPSPPGTGAQAAARASGGLQRNVNPVDAWAPTAAPIPQATIPCPKCGAAVREVARFCQRCHMTMRFDCPACGNKQRTGVKCQKCGINFVKYIGAVVAAKQPEQDTLEAKMDRRSALLKNVLAIPLTGGLKLFKQLFHASNRKS
jgi:hypothetical protein